MDLNDLDFNELGRWPLAARLIAVILLFSVIVGAGYWYFTQDKIAALEKVQALEPGLKDEFRKKQGKAANLEAYKQQMIEMEKSFGSMLRQLPQKTEVANLLVEISQTGLSTGLEFKLFKPAGESKKDFYAELPVKINVVGTYHQFGAFASGIAALPRIVTLHNVSFTPIGGTKKSTKANILEEVQSDVKLNISLTAKTYRYLDENEASDSRRKGKKKRKRR